MNSYSFEKETNIRKSLKKVHDASELISVIKIENCSKYVQQPEIKVTVTETRENWKGKADL